MRLVWQHQLDTPQAVGRYIENLEAQMQLLTEHRAEVRRDIARQHTPQERLVLIADRDQCTRALSLLRKNRSTALAILSDQPEIRQIMQAEKQMEYGQRLHTKRKTEDTNDEIYTCRN